MNSQSVWRSSTSTPAVGSSSTITGGPVDQRLRDQHTALHAARQGAHVGVGLAREIEVGEDLVDPVVVAADAVVARGQAQRLAHREERVEDEFLRHDPQRLTCGTEVVDHVVPHHRHLAGAGARQPGDDRDQRRLAGAIGPEQAEELALLNLQRDPAQGLELAVTLGDPLDVNRDGQGAVLPRRRACASLRRFALGLTNRSVCPRAPARRSSSSMTPTSDESNSTQAPRSSSTAPGPNARHNASSTSGAVSKATRAGARSTAGFAAWAASKGSALGSPARWRRSSRTAT